LMQNKMQPQENKQHKCKDVINVKVKSVHLTSKETGCLCTFISHCIYICIGCVSICWVCEPVLRGLRWPLMTYEKLEYTLPRINKSNKEVQHITHNKVE